MRVLISGATGLVGSALSRHLRDGGVTAGRLVRSTPSAPDDIRWDPAREEIDRSGLNGWDGFVHLAGENIAGGRWTAARKQRIRDSRVRGTAFLAREIAGLPEPPGVLVCASAVGFYGDRGDEVLTEESAAGSGFLAEVCKEWEAAAEPARQRGIRVVHLRFGIILSSKGGALAKMLTPFKLGVGGRLGDGRQYMSCISLDDVVRVAELALQASTLSGAVNTVGPESVTNREFTSTLARVLRRPAIFPVPGPLARLAFGEMADALLLASTRVLPRKLEQVGHTFLHPTLESALRAVLKRQAPAA